MLSCPCPGHTGGGIGRLRGSFVTPTPPAEPALPEQRDPNTPGKSVIRLWSSFLGGGRKDSLLHRPIWRCRVGVHSARLPIFPHCWRLPQLPHVRGAGSPAFWDHSPLWKSASQRPWGRRESGALLRLWLRACDRSFSLPRRWAQGQVWASMSTWLSPAALTPPWETRSTWRPSGECPGFLSHRHL